MAAKKAAKKTAKKTTTRKRRGVKLTPTELGAQELLVSEPPADLLPMLERVRADGGAVLGVYREPLGGHHLVPLGRSSARLFFPFGAIRFNHGT